MVNNLSEFEINRFIDFLERSTNFSNPKALEEAIRLRDSIKMYRITSAEFNHPTEQKYPQQVAAFREIIEKMYSTHLDKNSDYSPMNILATGVVGLATRIWDKTARICNLLGFNLQTGEYSEERKSKKDESIEDNLLDLAVYAIIALIFRMGKWGK